MIDGSAEVEVHKVSAAELEKPRITICVLAEEPRGCWRAVFESEKLHLYVEFAPSDKVDWMSIDDSWRAPREELHKQALERLLEQIARAFFN